METIKIRGDRLLLLLDALLLASHASCVHYMRREDFGDWTQKYNPQGLSRDAVSDVFERLAGRFELWDHRFGDSFKSAHSLLAASRESVAQVEFVVPPGFFSEMDSDVMFRTAMTFAEGKVTEALLKDAS